MKYCHLYVKTNWYINVTSIIEKHMDKIMIEYVDWVSIVNSRKNIEFAESIKVQRFVCKDDI